MLYYQLHMYLPGPRAYHGTACLGNKIYIVGGFDGMEYFNSVRCFDPLTKTWSEVAPMNAKRLVILIWLTKNLYLSNAEIQQAYCEVNLTLVFRHVICLFSVSFCF